MLEEGLFKIPGIEDNDTALNGMRHNIHIEVNKLDGPRVDGPLTATSSNSNLSKCAKSFCYRYMLLHLP